MLEVEGKEKKVTTVIHISKVLRLFGDEDAEMPAGTVRIDRKSRWGNPFIIGKDGDRNEVIGKYRDWLWAQVQKGEIGVDELASLHGKVLACWCRPHRCHGDVLSKAAAWAVGQKAKG